MITTQYSIGGSWHGSYGYGGGRRLPTYFDADFVFGGDPVNFAATIIDNGPMGEARGTGRQTGRQFTFTKSYVAPLNEGVARNVVYTGELSEDGNYVIGRWKLGIFGSGPWQMTRKQPIDYAATGQTWPPSIGGYEDPGADAARTTQAMTMQELDGRLILKKRPSPSVQGLEGQFIFIGIVLGYMIVNSVWQEYQYFVYRLTMSLSREILSTIYRLAIIAFLARYSVPWFGVMMFGDVYSLDRAKNKIVRNGKTVGKLSEIAGVELRPIGPLQQTGTVTILLRSGRRIFVETGRPGDVSELAQTVARYAGVGVVNAP